MLEGNANVISDKYNSKKAGNPDWYFNALAGLRINLGKSATKKEKPVEPEPAPAPVQKVEEPAPAPAPVVPAMLTRVQAMTSSTTASLLSVLLPLYGCWRSAMAFLLSASLRNQRVLVFSHLLRMTRTEYPS